MPQETDTSHRDNGLQLGVDTYLLGGEYLQFE